MTEIVRYKFPRIGHVPWSDGVGVDDIRLVGMDSFVGGDVVVLEKVDGENTTMYPDGICHARSIDSGRAPWRDYVRALAAQVSPLLRAYGPDIRIVGENLYARHSVAYDELPDWFMTHSVWRHDLCLSWDETVEIATAIGLSVVPELWSGTFLGQESLPEMQFGEGYVIRLSDRIPLDMFSVSVAKYVRAGHVSDDAEHWTEVWNRGFGERNRLSFGPRGSIG